MGFRESDEDFGFPGKNFSMF